MLPAPPLRPAPARPVLTRRRRAGGGIAGWPCQAGAVPGNGLLGVLGQVVPQMPAIGYLNRVPGAVPGALGVAAGPVPADDRRPRVRFSHASKVAASRSGSRSATSPVSMSTSTVPYTCPLRSAKSSTRKHFRGRGDLCLGEEPRPGARWWRDAR